jgi:DNA-binding response OmpR family regulator
MRILIVEDERHIAAFLERGLKEEGYAIDVVYNGNDALDWAAALEYDGIVLDVMLPGRDGFSTSSKGLIASMQPARVERVVQAWAWRSHTASPQRTVAPST